MADHYFTLSQQEQGEVLEQARQKSGRPAHLLEKDAWVVWALDTLFRSHLAEEVTFKGGTSLSKAYKVIDRFSEDIDLTCDIRALIPDVIGDDRYLPDNASQAKKWTRAVRDQLPKWIASEVSPLLQAALEEAQLTATLEVAGEAQDTLLLHYPMLTQGTGYVAPIIRLEFGGRATGEPHGIMPVRCDMEGFVDGVSFPTASPRVMSIARTFWEKATAAHVYCAQDKLRGERYARHWHDLAAIMRSSHFDSIIGDKDVARAVAEHKSYFFSEKDLKNTVIDYFTAVDGELQIVPTGDARSRLEADYKAMIGDHVLLGDPLSFDELMSACTEMAERLNAAAKSAAEQEPYSAAAASL